MYMKLVHGISGPCIGWQYFTRRGGQIRLKTMFAYPPGMKAYEDDYLEVAQYPTPDYETRHYSDPQKKKRENHFAWFKSIRNKGTVEEKLMELNINRNYGWKSYLLGEDSFQYDALPFIKYITRTYSFPDSQLPEIYSSEEMVAKVKHYSKLLQEPFEDVIKFELYGNNRIKKDEEREFQFARRCNLSVVNQVSRLMLQVLGAEEPLLNNIRVDYEPKLEAFWLMGGFHAPLARLNRIQQYEKEGRDPFWINEIRHQDIALQYTGSPILQIRSRTPMERFAMNDFKPESEPLNEFHHLPSSYNYTRQMRYATNVAGYWSGDSANSSLLSFHSAHFLESCTPDGTPVELDLRKHPAYITRKSELLESQAILNSFSKLFSQAYMLGFDQFSDTEYPLSTQTILFNGQEWTFSCYQLNTMKLDKFGLKENSKQNFSWTIPFMSTFDENGRANPLVLEMLLKFFLAPTFSKEVEYQMPNIKWNLKDVTDDYHREFVLYNFHEMFSLRRQDVLCMQMPEIYDWEKIYKIAHNTRPMDARKRFYEKPDHNTYSTRYSFKEPRYRPKRLKFLEAELEEKKQEAQVKAVKASLADRFKDRESNER